MVCVRFEDIQSATLQQVGGYLSWTEGPIRSARHSADRRRTAASQLQVHVRLRLSGFVVTKMFQKNPMKKGLNNFVRTDGPPLDWPSIYLSV